jgi:GTP-sensing pleiotropic transcriptional regulator CodY
MSTKAGRAKYLEQTLGKLPEILLQREFDKEYTNSNRMTSQENSAEAQVSSESTVKHNEAKSLVNRGEITDSPILSDIFSTGSNWFACIARMLERGRLS